MNNKKLVKKLYASFLIGIVGSLLFIAIFPRIELPYSAFSEKEFFNLLDDNVSELAKIKETANEGNYDKAKEMLKDYFLSKSKDLNFNRTSMDLEEVEELADLAIKRKFTVLGVTRKLYTYPYKETRIVNNHEIPNTNWHKNPYPEDVEWIWQLSRGGWIIDLARGYETNYLLGNNKEAKYYGKWFVDSLTDYIEKESVGSQFTWRTIDSGLRVPNLLSAFDMIKNSDAFTPEFCYLYLRFILDHGKYLVDHHKNEYNWAFIEAKAIINICMFLPEFTIIKEWEKIAWDTFEYAIDQTFYSDGGSREQAMNYHSVALSRIGDVMIKAEDYEHINVPKKIYRNLEDAFVFNLYNIMPDNLSTSFGDSRRDNRIYIAKQGSNLYSENNDLSFINPDTGSPSGKEPPDLNAYFQESGYFISRSTWNRTNKIDVDALYSIFDGGKYGDFYHKHNDFGSIQLYGFNRTLIIDPGIVDYSNDEKTRYYRSSYSHNVIHIDNEAQNGINPINNMWSAGYLGSFASATHLQYGSPLERRVIFCNFRNNLKDNNLKHTSRNNDTNRYWIVSDFWHFSYYIPVFGSHDVEMLWQLPYSKMIPINCNSEDLSSDESPQKYIYNVRTNFTRGNLAIYGFGPWKKMQTIHGGSSDDYGQPFGWRNDNETYGKESKATTLRYLGELDGPTSWFTVLYPCESRPNLTIYPLAFKVDNEEFSNSPKGNNIGNVFAIETQNGKDLHINLMEERKVKLNYLGYKIQFNGTYLSLHFNKTNQLTQLLTKNAIELKIDGNNVLKFNDNIITFSKFNNIRAITLGFSDDFEVDSVYDGDNEISKKSFEDENNAINFGMNVLESADTIKITLIPPPNITMEDVIEKFLELRGIPLFIVFNFICVLLALYFIKIIKKPQEKIKHQNKRKN
ncbi:MAG: heparinase II/III family protein [Promethearchaeota archaeon]